MYVTPLDQIFHQMSAQSRQHRRPPIHESETRTQRRAGLSSSELRAERHRREKFTRENLTLPMIYLGLGIVVYQILALTEGNMKTQ